MCGITGIIAFTEKGKNYFGNIKKANDCLSQRGPDNEGFYTDGNIAFGHRRLSIIDISDSANQPMHDEEQRFTIIFNGEFFNYRFHRDKLIAEGVKFRTSSDTEVLLKLYMREGPSFLEKVNGFFALAIYDRLKQTVFIARDRMGIKPLFYYIDNDKFFFGSELKSLMALGIPKVADRLSILTYLQLNYIPGPATIFERVNKLRPGHYFILQIKNDNPEVNEVKYYEIPPPLAGRAFPDYYTAQKQLRHLLYQAVEKRLIADVPLGAFLSGGIDSSVIVALASSITPHLNTFSIGYKDESHYDETHYAQLVADRFKTNHTVFSLSNDDLYANLHSVLDYIDEPFADSSALAVNILSMHTRKKVTVSLSGDGADEMFGGYNKHRAEWIIRNRPLFTRSLETVAPLLRTFSGTRTSPLSNKLRQLHRFSDGASRSARERYWRWCGFVDEQDARKLLKIDVTDMSYASRKNSILRVLGKAETINDILNMDMHLVLTNDMLVKVDMMSMAHSLEVRVPFLDFELVNFVAGLPSDYKIDKHSSKKILRETFRNDLPEELFSRPKHGFEVPLLKWLRSDLKAMITDELLSEDFIVEQNLFNYPEIEKLKTRLFSSTPGDIEARIWGLIVFQYWWKKYMLH
jgi:asparagine synthase (glutamine-hydrolysing)